MKCFVQFVIPLFRVISSVWIMMVISLNICEHACAVDLFSSVEIINLIYILKNITFGVIKRVSTFFGTPIYCIYVRSKFVLGVNYTVQCSQCKMTPDIKYIHGQYELLLLAICSRSKFELDVFSLSAKTRFSLQATKAS
jgi:hypothetical protein